MRVSFFFFLDQKITRLSRREASNRPIKTVGELPHFAKVSNKTKPDFVTEIIAYNFHWRNSRSYRNLICFILEMPPNANELTYVRRQRRNSFAIVDFLCLDCNRNLFVFDADSDSQIPEKTVQILLQTIRQNVFVVGSMFS